MISKFYCLTGISPKDNSQFEGLHHEVGNKERVLLNFLKFGSMHIKSKSEFNSKLERTSDLFLLVCFGHFFNTAGEGAATNSRQLLDSRVHSSLVAAYSRVCHTQVGRTLEYATPR